MKHFLQLIRFENLLIVALTQYLIRYFVVIPSLEYSFQPFIDVELTLPFSHFHFFLLVLATMLVTGAGYVINDYFDRKTDLFNKPNKVVVSTHIPRRTAMTIHWVFNAISVFIAAYLSYYVGILNLTLIFLFSTGLLWFYSTTFSKEIIIGNVIVALLTAMVPMLVIVYDFPLLYDVYGFKLKQFGIDFNQIAFFVIGFSVFAFITTLVREIIKDIEDVEGDNISGRNTLPIVIGSTPTKYIAIALILITIASIGYVVAEYIPKTSAYIYTISLLVLPSCFLIYKLVKASTTKDFHVASLIQKLIMLAGLGFTGLLYFIISNKTLL